MVLLLDGPAISIGRARDRAHGLTNRLRGVLAVGGVPHSWNGHPSE